MNKNIKKSWFKAMRINKYKKTNGWIIKYPNTPEVCYCAIGVLGKVMGMTDDELSLAWMGEIVNKALTKEEIKRNEESKGVFSEELVYKIYPRNDRVVGNSFTPVLEELEKVDL